MSENKVASIQKNIYDNARNHFLGNFPESLPIEQAYVHIGMYLGWVIQNDLYSEYFEEEAEHQIFRFKRRELSCTILSEIWDGYLGYELFNKEGNMFAYYYYGGGIYKKDYVTLLAGDLPSLYHVKDTWENFEIICNKISSRFNEWKKIIT
jgi:hypothetical protein